MWKCLCWERKCNGYQITGLELIADDDTTIHTGECSPEGSTVPAPDDTTSVASYVLTPDMLSLDSLPETVRSEALSSGDGEKDEQAMAQEVVTCLELTGLISTGKTRNGDILRMASGTVTGSDLSSKGKHASYALQAVNCF